MRFAASLIWRVLAPALRRVVQQADRDLPHCDLRTQREQIDENMQTERMFGR